VSVAQGMPTSGSERPPWLRARVRATRGFAAVERAVREKRLHTVCFSAACPNLGECWARGTATFMIGGDVCTRRCGFCDVTTGRPLRLDPGEPRRVAEGVAELGIEFAVITAWRATICPTGAPARWRRRSAPFGGAGRGPGSRS